MHIHKRKKQAIIKTPHISVTDNASEYYYSLIVLYVPFRIEANILLGHDSAENAYIHHFTNVINNPYIKEIEKTEQLSKAIELKKLLRDTNETFKFTTENILDNNDFERADDEIPHDYEEIEIAEDSCL